MVIASKVRANESSKQRLNVIINILLLSEVLARSKECDETRANKAR